MALLNLGRLRALRYERNRFNAATRPVDGQYPGMQGGYVVIPLQRPSSRIHKQITTRLHEVTCFFLVLHIWILFWTSFVPSILAIFCREQTLVFHHLRRFLEICSSCGLEAQHLLFTPGCCIDGVISYIF